MRILVGAAICVSLAIGLFFYAGEGKFSSTESSKIELAKTASPGRAEVANRSATAVVPSAAAAERPNILVILSDDQTLDDQSVMEKTNALLGAEGTTFQRFYTQHGICCPSRATFLTGQYPHNHGVLYNTLPGGYTALDHSETLAVWLQSSGYYTAYIGKYLNGLGRDTSWDTRPPGWDDWQALIKAYLMYGWTMNDNGTLIEAGSAPEDYQTDALAARAEAVIRSREGKPEPFFLVVSPATPHKESSLRNAGKKTIRPAPRHVGAFADAPLPKPPSYNERDVSDKPRFIRKLPLITPEVEAEITKRFRDRREALLSLDDLVAQLVATLDDTGQLDDTVIIYWSDNGYEFGEHRIPDNKNEVYEESLRAPLIIWGGGFPAGATPDQLVANIDIAPTIVALAGATAGRVMDGRDLRPLAHDPRLGKGRSLLINAYHGENYTNGIRTDTGYLWAEHGRGQPELYDLNNDPYQLQSQHRNRAYRSQKMRLENELEGLKDCSGASCSMGQ